jgi:RNA polymerase sigma factor FliA
MEQRTSTGHKHSQLPVSLYPLPQKPAPASRAAGYEEAALSTEGAQTTVSEEILREHLPMVRFLALRIRERLPQQVEMEDLISAGVVGLIDAMQKFDSRKKVQFRTYAQFRVRGAILDSLRALDWGPRELRRKGRACRRGDSVPEHAAGQGPDRK